MISIIIVIFMIYNFYVINNKMINQKINEIFWFTTTWMKLEEIFETKQTSKIKTES